MKNKIPFAGRILFRHPAIYRIKYCVIETVIWRWLFSGLLRVDLRPLTETDGLFCGLRIFLAACGPGDVSTGPSIDSAAEIFACDISPEFALACRNNQPRWQVGVADVVRLPYADGAFDVSAVYSSLHHIPAHADQVLAELARVTRSRIVILEGVVPRKGLLRRLLLLWYRIVDGGFHYYTREEILSIAGKLGMHVERATLHGPIRHMLFCVLNLHGD
jgi:ubiquinone/menaquinone biosynthesis C-methylase UbiE